MRLAKITVAAALSASIVASLSTAASAGNEGAFIGGLAVGALAGAAIAGGNPAPAYGGPGYRTYAAPVYSPRHCWFEAQPVFDQWGNQVGARNVQRCGY
jgi:hypothetical protein